LGQLLENHQAPQSARVAVSLRTAPEHFILQLVRQSQYLFHHVEHFLLDDPKITVKLQKVEEVTALRRNVNQKRGPVITDVITLMTRS